MITHFNCSDTQAFFKGERIQRFIPFERVAIRKLQQLNAATDLAFYAYRPATDWRHSQGKHYRRN